ncbi:MAG: magnesium/cobalt transporter CorA [Mesorhizobium sp.]|nr:magnesium/cobalt transporter CorA [Mesorhizobium sp.]MBL8576753.1 magnesium/cobalt transporter CorA [Mesorhizobium sp.]
MIKAFVAQNEHLHPVDHLTADSSNVVWVDLFNPTKDEENTVEEWLGVEVPTREEMEEIEVSSRLYAENGAYVMTATLPAHTDGDRPEMLPVTFMLAGERLITIRYHEPRAFQTFPMHAEKADVGCTNGETILVSLLEAIVDRLADVLERASKDVVDISRDMFDSTEKKASKRDRDFRAIIHRIGSKEDLVSKVQDSLLTLQRLSGYLANVVAQDSQGKVMRARVKTLARDVSSLSDHASFQTQKINFLLDATLGMINIEQNGIIKIFSVAAVVFLPPTLVASVYGMNFEGMPELKWAFGYPIALGIMVLSAILPFWFFRRKGWL